jgi:putative endonuclease
MTAPDPRRELGAKGEALARRHLEARGYTLLDANFRTRHGELDLVAADPGHLVFCEVKTRVLSGPPGELGPLAAIGARKRRQVRSMAREWLAQRARGRPSSDSTRSAWPSTARAACWCLSIWRGRFEGPRRDGVAADTGPDRGLPGPRRGLPRTREGRARGLPRTRGTLTVI